MLNIKHIIKDKETEAFKFSPSILFYHKVGIGRKRFWQLYRNEKSPTLDELQALSDYFNVPTERLISYEPKKHMQR